MGTTKKNEATDLATLDEDILESARLEQAERNRQRAEEARIESARAALRGTGLDDGAVEAAVASLLADEEQRRRRADAAISAAARKEQDLADARARAEATERSAQKIAEHRATIEANWLALLQSMAAFRSDARGLLSLETIEICEGKALANAKKKVSMHAIEWVGDVARQAIWQG